MKRNTPSVNEHYLGVNSATGPFQRFQYGDLTATIMQQSSGDQT